MDGINPRAVIGGNNPPLAEKHADLAERVKSLCATELPIMVPNDDTAAHVAAVGKDANMLARLLDDTRTAEKAPHLEAGRQVDAYFKGLTTQVERFLGDCKRLVGAWQDQKRAEEQAARAAALIAAREAAEAAAAAAQTEADLQGAIEAEAAAEKAQAATQAKPAELARVTSGGYVVAQQRTTWAYEVTDLAAVPREWLQINDAKVKAALQVHKGALAIPGIKPVERRTTVL